VTVTKNVQESKIVPYQLLNSAP